MNNKKVLILAAHPDDEIIGCGGSIKYFQSEGYKVGVVFFTNGVSSRTKSSKLIKERKNNLTNPMQFAYQLCLHSPCKKVKEFSESTDYFKEGKHEQ